MRWVSKQQRLPTAGVQQMPAYLLVQITETKPKCEFEHCINPSINQSNPHVMLLQTCMPVCAA